MISAASTQDLTWISVFQVLIKKDKEDQNDAAMSGFLDKLVTAYQDPALMPVHYSANTDSLNRPLISSAEV